MAYRPPHQPGQASGYGNMVPTQMYMAGNFNATGNQQPRPGNAQFMQPRAFAGVAPQRYAMMQPGMGPGGYTPQMYPGQVPTQGVMGMGQVPMGYPQQQPQMGQQQYTGQQIPQQHGHNPMLEQQKRMAEAQQHFTEKQKKERYLEEQRRKLRQFSKGGTAALGTAKLDFDNLLGSKDVGKDGGSNPRPAMGPQQQIQPRAGPTNQPQPIDADDSFGDFLQGPTTTQPATKPSTGSIEPREPAEDDFGDFLQGPGAMASEQQQVAGETVKQVHDPEALSKDSVTSVEQKVEETKPEGPTLESLMMASTDFSTNTSQKFKPTKRTLRDAKPTHSKLPANQPLSTPSQKAHAWTDAQNFSRMFSPNQGVPQGSVVGPGVPQGSVVGPGVPQGSMVGPGIPQGSMVGPGVPQGSMVGPGVPQGSVVGPFGAAEDDGSGKPGGKFDGGNLPAWCLNERVLPLVYYQVLEACVRDGVIQTELVYPILILSGLDKAVLGHIWNMANRTSPGRLTKHELFFVLGMVALAQNGQPLNIEVTSGLKEAPVPNLTRTQGGQIAIQASADNVQQPMPGNVVVSNTGLGGDNDEFAAFQAAGPKPGQSSVSTIQAISTPLPSASVAPSQSEHATMATMLQPSSSITIPSSKSKSSSIPSLSLSAAPRSSDGTAGIPMKATLSSSGVAVKLGDMGNMEDVGYDSRYPKEEENCYIFAGSPPDESESSGRSSPLVWDPNCIYDKLTIRSKDDSESTSSLSDRTPVDEDDEEEEQFDDFKSAPSSSSGIEDFSHFQMAALKDDNKKESGSSKSSFTFEKVKPSAIAKIKDLPSIPPPKGQSSKESTVDDFGMLMSSGSQIGQPPNQGKLSKFASFDAGMITSSTRVVIPKPLAAPAGREEFTEFKQAGKMETTFGVFQDTPPKKSFSINDFTPYQASKKGSATQAGAASSKEDDFADFSQFKHSASEGDLMGMTQGEQDDKYAALRDLTMGSTASQPEFGIGLAATPEELDEDDFEDFQQAEPVTNSGMDQSKKPIGTSAGLNLDTNIPLPSSSAMDDSFADFQQADVSSGSGLYGFVSSDDVTVIRIPASSGGSIDTPGTIKPVSLQGSNLLSAGNQQTSSSWLDNIPLDREPPPDDDFGDFQTTNEPLKSTPDTLSVGKSDDSGSLNEFKKGSSASDLYGMEFDSFGAVPDEDPPLSPALNLDDQPTPDEAPKQVDPVMAFSSHSSGKLPKVNNIASLDLTTLDLDLNLGSRSASESKENRSNSFGDFSSAPAMSPMDSNNLEPVRSMNPVGPMISSAPLVPQGTTFIGDRYSQVAGEIQDDNRHAHEWQRCLETCYASIKKANDVFNGISSSAVCNEVIRSTEGSDYLTAVIEIYRVACRIVTSMKAMGAETEDLQELEKDIDLVWNNLSAFLAASPLHPDDGSFVFKTAVLRPEPSNKERACGVCLLNVDSRSKAFDHSKDNHKLSYGGRQYHATCANLWVNMVDSLLPALPLNSLL